MIRFLLLAAFAGWAHFSIAADGSLPPRSMVVSPAHASDARISSKVAVVLKEEVSVLTVYNRPVLAFRAENQGISPADRVKRARLRIADQLSRPGSHVVSLRADASGYQVHIDGVTSFFIVHGDLDPSREDTLAQTSERAGVALSQAIAESKEGRNIETLFQALGKALLGSAVFVAVVWALGRALGALMRRLAKLTDQHTSRLESGGAAWMVRNRVALVVRWTMILLQRVLVLVLTVQWLSFVLSCFPFSRAWGESLNTFLPELATPILQSRRCLVYSLQF